MKYLLGSGFYSGSDRATRFVDYWRYALRVNTTVTPDRVVILSVGGCGAGFSSNEMIWISNKFEVWPRIEEIHLSGNLGHCEHLLHGTKPHEYTGWAGAVLALALLAYNNETDFIFVEQDCIVHGPYVERMYKEIGDGKMIFGHLTFPDGAMMQPCAQALFLIKHEFIPEFVRSYLSLGDERSEGRLTEHKFAQLEQMDPQSYRRFTFGYDRGRPKDGIENCNDEVCYFQQLTDGEIEILKRKNWLC